MLLSIDGTFLIQILNFVLFWVLLTYIFIAPMRRAIEQRQRYIAGLYQQADGFTAEARALQAQADAILNEARKQTDELMRAASAKASDEAHAIEREAANQAAATVQLAHATVAQERAQALARQQAFVHELARSMVERATGFEEVA
jgi:F-type H+-transporting ATPase subunit b